MDSTKLAKIYDKLEKSNVIVNYVPFFEKAKAISYLSPSNTFWIGLNKKLISSEKEEVCVIMEEQAHYEVGIIPNDYTSNSYCDRITREKNEFRAKKWAVKKLISKEELFKAIKRIQYINIDELADEFEVTQQFMKEALIVYGFI